MSSQESLFSPQENRPCPPENNDPREPSYEQTTWQEERSDAGSSSYEMGYSSVTPTMDRIYGWGEKLRPSAPSLPPRQWIIGAIILFALASAVWSLINFIFGSNFLFLVGLMVAVIAISQLWDYHCRRIGPLE